MDFLISLRVWFTGQDWRSRDDVSVLRPLAMLGNGYELNGIIEYWRYYVGALLCSTGVGSAWKRLRARQHDRNTESRMLVHYRSSY